MSTDTDTSTDDLHFTDRLALIAHDLRQVSLWLEGHRDEWDAAGLDAPYVMDGAAARLRLGVMCNDLEQFAAAARILADGAALGSVTKRYDDHGAGYARLDRRFGSVVIEAWALRDRVCAAVVVGSETVEVPDPDAPTLTVTRDVIEWVCRPVLGVPA